VAPGVHLVALDSASSPRYFSHWGGGIPNEELIWLDEELARNEGKTIIVMMHHALIPHIGERLPSYIHNRSGLYCDNADKVKEILGWYGVQIVITGHFHVTDIAEDPRNGIYDISCPATCSYPCAYRICNLLESENRSKLDVDTFWYDNDEIRRIAKEEYRRQAGDKFAYLTKFIGMVRDPVVVEGKLSDRYVSLSLRSKLP